MTTEAATAATAAVTTPAPVAAPAPVPGTPEHDAAMIAKAASIAPKADTPAPVEAPAQVETPAPAADTPANPEQAAAEAAATEAGFDYATLATEFNKDGKLSDETYAALDKKGIPRSIVDSYIAGQQAIADQTRATFENRMGGKETFDRIYEWARNPANFSDADRNAFNALLDAGTNEAVGFAMDGLKAKYEAAMGSEPNLLGGGAPAGADVFASRNEVVEAMSDRRYGRDPAYTDKVVAKIARSGVF